MERTTLANETRHCLECGKIILGRKDKKYCDEFCRTAFNNRLRSEGIAGSSLNEEPDPVKKREVLAMAAIRKIHETILENRNKLKKAFEANGYQVAIEEFNGYGINLKYFTSFYFHHDLYKQFQMCFDYGYCIDDDFVWLIGISSELDILGA